MIAVAVVAAVFNDQNESKDPAFQSVRQAGTVDVRRSAERALS